MRPRWSALFFCFIKDTADYIGAFLLLGLIQMGIDICRCGQVGVPEEGRYIQQRHILIDEDAGEGVAQVVKPNFAQTVLLDQVGEPLCDPIRAYQPAELINTDIIIVFAVVTALEHSPVQVLLFPFLAQHFIHRVRQRQCTAAGFVFHFLHGFDDNLAVFLILNDFGVEQYGFLFPIYSRPPCAQRLAAAQPQAARQHDRRIDNIPADKPEHGDQLLLGIVFSGELVFLRAVDAVKGIGVNQSVLESPFEGAVQDGVVVDNGVGDYARCEHPLVEILNVLCGDAADRQFPAGSKIPPNSTVYHSAVAFGGTLLNVFLDLFKVGAHIIVDRDKKPLKKEFIERIVAEDAMALLTPERIDTIADMAIKGNQEDLENDEVIPALRAEIQELDKSISNLLKLVEKGAESETLAARLTDLEKRKRDVERRLVVAEDDYIILDKPLIVRWLSQFLNGDIEDEDFRRQIIDLLVNSVTVWDEPDGYYKITSVYNLMEEEVKSFRVKADGCSDLRSQLPP